MKKYILLSLFFFAFANVDVSGQVPGYQGKRFSLGYNASTFFYFTEFEGAGFGDIMTNAIFSTTISYKTELYLNFALSRKVCGGFSYYFAKQKDNFVFNDIDNVGNYVPVKNSVLCKLSIYELHFQFFRKNFIAPVGLYHQFSIAIVNYSLGEPGNKMEIRPESGNTSSYIAIDGPLDPYQCFKLGYSIGKTNPVGHNFYLTTAFGVNFFRGGDSPLPHRASITKQNYLLENFNRNLRTHNLFEIKLGLGWLAF
ncbi:hypothetical protein BH09BAC5_BH09BAC5_16440 [soil metagenome]